jgi:tRNA(fMet)-specific endonuclease VapC
LKEIIGYDNCFISEITLAELKYGAELSEKTDENLRSVNEFANKIGVLPIRNGLILVTNNENHFERIKNIKIENWIKK